MRIFIEALDQRRWDQKHQKSGILRQSFLLSSDHILLIFASKNVAMPPSPDPDDWEIHVRELQPHWDQLQGSLLCVDAPGESCAIAGLCKFSHGNGAC